MSKLHTRKN